jgi:hypothetical protein
MYDLPFPRAGIETAGNAWKPGELRTLPASRSAVLLLPIISFASDPSLRQGGEAGEWGHHR